MYVELIHNKLRSYMKFNGNFLAEYSLQHFTQVTARKSFTKLHISAHDLKIECGHHQQPQIPV